MSTRAAVAEIVNNYQADMLELMRAAPGPLTLRDLQDGMGFGRTMIMRHLAGLRERALVDVIQTVDPVAAPRTGQGRNALRYTITRSGSRALARYKRRTEQEALEIVPPPTHNTAGTTYTPPPRSYYRNEGNAHIASRGVAC